MIVNYPPIGLQFEPTPLELAQMVAARLRWLRGIGDAGGPWPGEVALSAFATGFLIARRAEQ